MSTCNIIDRQLGGLGRRITCVVATIVLLISIMGFNYSSQAQGAELRKIDLNISKIGADTNKSLEGSKLEIRRNQNGSTGVTIEEWESDGSLHQTKLMPGEYKLLEKEAPKGYSLAEPIIFKVQSDGSVLVKDSSGSFVETPLKHIDSKSVTAFSDFNDDSMSWPGTPYGKFYYAKTTDSAEENSGKGEVVYCLNIERKAPPESYDGTGNDVKPNILQPNIVTYERVNDKNVAKYLDGAVTDFQEGTYDKLAKIVWAGYPNDSQNIGQELKLTATQFRTATQLAIYHLTDNFDVQKAVNEGKESHGFEGILKNEEPNSSVKKAYEKLIAYAGNTDEQLPGNSTLNFYSASQPGYQNLIGTKLDNPSYVPTLQMVDKKQEEPSLPKISTEATIDGEKEKTLSQAKSVEVVDTIAWKDLPAGKYVAEATYVVNNAGQESVVVGEQKFVVTKDQAAFGEATVPVILTIPESALTADGQPVKFTVLERVFKADDAGKKTGDAVAEHVEKDSDDQTVTVTVKKPVAPKPSISTVATVNGEKSVELDGVKPVEVVDTIAWKDLPAGKYVAEATYVVNNAGQESVVVGEQKFVVTKDQAAFGEATVPVILTIPESALTADGQPVKFTVLERVFKADDAGKKTGDAVAEHVEKDSDDQTVTVTVKKPIAPAPSTVAVNFSKVIAGQGDELKGAALKIVKGDKADGSDVVAEWISTGAVKTFELNEGIYTLVEDQAPLGFLKAEAITFRVTNTVDSKKIEILQNGVWVEAKDSTITMEDVRDTSPKTPAPEKKQTPETPKPVPNQSGNLAKTGINLAGLSMVTLLLVAGGAVLLRRKKA
ncbi:Cys-Gln thioester bond-forming surface protein [Arcanobacterium phocisimile]|uniref:Cys-Gln thioester bond-forming surface protein n=1 Tax=Arcanobacterium phocisimile TaxID=1302235 RepID=A0ABX7IGM0_9ACTO|nr:SpaA isopeptide-forming pilin-related protein [Arcanobacterium phocisimile]QRV02116.1 Cys-Gln thioester bond-forming surface protein [Arcanobacterium phocisimile]